jgi:Protein of unknown function (DUF3306)
MSEPENFLARWSRLKREAAVEVSGGGEHAPVGMPPIAHPPPVTAFDPATLPPIELIDAATDIRPFLEACVPEALTRAALRSTWSADPAIRDFIGIAENQWDFNDPATIPGFGVQAAADYLSGLAAHGVGSLNAVDGGLEESARMLEQPVSQDSASTASDPTDAGRPVTPALSDRSPDADCGGPAADEPGPTVTRTHGGALPR